MLCGKPAVTEVSHDVDYCAGYQECMLTSPLGIIPLLLGGLGWTTIKIISFLIHCYFARYNIHFKYM